MIRKAFLMQVHPEHHQTYEQRHTLIWDELVRILKVHGVHQYSIFIDAEKHQLFAYVEIESVARWNEISHTEICQKWWRYMADIMPSNPDFSPISQELKSVFYLA